MVIIHFFRPGFKCVILKSVFYFSILRNLKERICMTLGFSDDSDDEEFDDEDWDDEDWEDEDDKDLEEEEW